MRDSCGLNYMERRPYMSLSADIRRARVTRASCLVHGLPLATGLHFRDALVPEQSRLFPRTQQPSVETRPINEIKVQASRIHMRLCGAAEALGRLSYDSTRQSQVREKRVLARRRFFPSALPGFAAWALAFRLLPALPQGLGPKDI